MLLVCLRTATVGSDLLLVDGRDMLAGASPIRGSAGSGDLDDGVWAAAEDFGERGLFRWVDSEASSGPGQAVRRAPPAAGREREPEGSL